MEQTMSSEKPFSESHNSNRNLPLEPNVDKMSVYQTILRILVHLEQKDYTEGDLRQADVLQHDDPPNPASIRETSQG
jgi:hypothetical protein